MDNEKELENIVRDPAFLGFNIKKASEDNMGKLRDADALLKILAAMVAEVRAKETKDVVTNHVNPNVLDITEKLEKRDRIFWGRLEFTLKNLARVAHLEILRRDKLKEK